MTFWETKFYTMFQRIPYSSVLSLSQPKETTTWRKHDSELCVQDFMQLWQSTKYQKSQYKCPLGYYLKNGNTDETLLVPWKVMSLTYESDSV